MLRNYPILEGDKTIGSAVVETEGMCFKIYCQCVPISGLPSQLEVVWKHGSCRLGICVPDGSRMTLLKRISKKCIPEEDIVFRVMEENIGELIKEDCPVGDLSKIKVGRLKMKDGMYYLVADQTRSKPTGQ